MAKLFGLDGREISTEPDRITPHVDIDSEEGRFRLPVVVLAGPSYDALVHAITSSILEELIPKIDALCDFRPSKKAAGQLVLPLETV